MALYRFDEHFRLNEDIDRAVRGVCDIRPECLQNAFRIRIVIVASE